MVFLDEITGIGGDRLLNGAYAAYSEGAFAESLPSFGDIGSGEADYVLAFHYLNGNGVKRDVGKAFSLFVSSMNKGYIPAIAEVAQCHGYGIGTKVDDSKAFELFSQAAEAGDPYGMSMLSMMYRNGDGVKRDKKKADEWSEKCEDAGDIDDYEDPGLGYLAGGNTILGRLYLMRSAVMGSPVSAKALECVYAFGKGVKADDEEAGDWRDTAECNGWDEVTVEDLKGYGKWFSEFIDIGGLGNGED